jgi:hypothetical protein
MVICVDLLEHLPAAIPLAWTKQVLSREHLPGQAVMRRGLTTPGTSMNLERFQLFG